MTPRANTYVTDFRHYLDDQTGHLPADIPAPALRLAMFLASIVAWATSQDDDDGELTNVWCWRRPNRRPCRGEIVARVESASAEIIWNCPSCGLNGVIRGWEDSLWDHRRSS
jgi:hypothetical protein